MTEPDFISRLPDPFDSAGKLTSLNDDRLGEAWVRAIEPFREVLARGAPHPGDLATAAEVSAVASKLRRMATQLEEAGFDSDVTPIAASLVPTADALDLIVRGMEKTDIAEALKEIKAGTAGSTAAMERVADDLLPDEDDEN